MSAGVPTLPDGWNLVSVEDAMSAIIDYRGKTPEKTRSGVPLVTAKIVKSGRIMPPDEFIAEDEYEAWMRRGMVYAGDVVVTTEAPLGEVAQLDDTKVALAQRLIALRGKPDVLDNTFLRFSMQSSFVQDQLHARASGTTVIGIRQRELRLVKLALPPLPKQRTIGGVLRALDDKIEQNRQTARVLERLARAIFRAWFVEFEPVQAKAIGASSFPSMPQAVFDTLPSTFTNSDLGPVPERWDVAVVSEMCEVNPPRPLRKGVLAPCLEMKYMPTHGHAPEAWEERPFGSGTRFTNGDTLVARITPCLENGKTAFVDFLQDGQVAWGSTEYIVLRPKPPLPPEFAYCLARTSEFRDFAIQNMTGTSGRQRVAPTAMDHFRLAVPPEDLAIAFGEIVQPLFDRIRVGMDETRKLAALRDYLLPQLLNGQISVQSPECAEAGGR